MTTPADRSFIDLEALRQTALSESPFPFVVIPNFLRKNVLLDLSSDFPRINVAGSVPLRGLAYGTIFAQLIRELEGPMLRAAISQKLDTNLEGRPAFITLRGRTRMKDGRIHTDTKSKLVTLLLYFNPKWDVEGGRLRVLRSGNNLEDFVVEIPPVLGTCLIFKVTDNCWHGHKPFVGTRKTIQLNYLADESALKKHLSMHSFSAKFKNFVRRFAPGDRYTE